MIRAAFQVTKTGSIKGFSVNGHSGYAQAGSDIVCASVSSAVMLAINTAAQFFNIKLDVKVLDGDISCGVAEISQNSDRLIKSLIAHLKEVEREFPKHLKVNISEV